MVGNLLLFVLLGLTAASKEKRFIKPDEMEDDYKYRLDEAYKSLGQCILFNSMTVTEENLNVTEDCIEGSSLQALLPALYAEVSLKPSECFEDIQEKLSQDSAWDNLEYQLMRFKTRKATERKFCRFLDKYLVPLVCEIQTHCSKKSDKQMVESIIASYYSIQQFFAMGVNSNFNCKKNNITINPVLYKFGTKFDPDMQYLSTPLKCEKFQSKLTTAAPTTTTETSKWWWDKENDGSPSKDENSSTDTDIDIPDLFDSSESQEEGSTSTSKPTKGRRPYEDLDFRKRI